MSAELSHAELQELLGAFALDAVEGPERAAVELHLRGCPRCRAEVAEHREVAAFLAHSGLRAPEKVWDRIAGALEEAPPRLDLAPVVPMAGSRRRRRRVAAALGSAAAAAAVASVAVLGLQLNDMRDRLERTEVALVQGDVAQAALVAESLPDARMVSLRSGDGRHAARAVVLRDGRAYLIAARMPALPPGRTYQLWAVVDETAISAGVLGEAPRVFPFQLETSGPVTLAVTVEDAPGVVASKEKPVAAGTLDA